MRVIGGELKSRKLQSVRGLLVRPTADRLRETIFNILSYNVKEKNVIDLFAGTGALGIESLSRRAKKAVFVDKDENAVSAIIKNIKSLGLTERAVILKRDILKNLNFLKDLYINFDLVFMDPPYNKNLIKPALLNLHKTDTLKKNATIVIEHSISEAIPDDLEIFSVTDQRKYGSTLVSFLAMD